MTLLQTVIARGTHASRPAAAIAGALYYETDTFTMFRDTGSAWEIVDIADIITTKGDILVGSAADVIGRLGVGSNNQVLTADSAQTLGVKWATAASGSVATDTIWDTKGDLAAATGADAAVKVAVGSNGQILTADSTQTAGIKWAAPASGAAGASALIYRYTVAGSDKSSIDTGVDTADAGSSDWTNGDLLEVFVFARTDEAGVFRSTINMTLNNDTSSIYDRQYVDVSNTSVSGSPVVAQAQWQFVCSGNSGGSGVCGAWGMSFPNYMGTTFNKHGEFRGGVAEPTGSACQFDVQILGYRSTSAVSRLKIIPNTGGVKFKVGTQLLIYKRTAS